MTIRVPREHRRQGVGTALHRRASEHARALGKSRFYCVVRHDDADSLAYYATRGFEEAGRMQDVFLELATAQVEPAAPPGIEIVPLTPDHERGTLRGGARGGRGHPDRRAACRAGTFEQWRDRNLGALAVRELSFVALDERAGSSATR